LSTTVELVAAEVDSGFFPAAPVPVRSPHRVKAHVGSAPTLIQRRERGSVMMSCEFVHSGARADVFRGTSIALASGDPSLSNGSGFHHASLQPWPGLANHRTAAGMEGADCASTLGEIDFLKAPPHLGVKK